MNSQNYEDFLRWSMDPMVQAYMQNQGLIPPGPAPPGSVPTPFGPLPTGPLPTGPLPTGPMPTGAMPTGASNITGPQPGAPSGAPSTPNQGVPTSQHGAAPNTINMQFNAVNHADFLKTSGNEALKEGNFRKALKFYTEALEVLSNVDGSDELKGVLYSNRSYAFFQLGGLDEAFDDAEDCIRTRPDWHKGYYRSFIVSKKCLEYHVAAQTLVKAFTSHVPMLEKEKHDFAKEIALLLPELAEKEISVILEDLEHAGVEESTWRSVVVQLLAEAGNKSRWLSVYWLLLGTDQSPGPLDSFNAKTVLLHEICRDLDKSPAWKKCGPKMIVCCLRNGANWESLKYAGSPPLCVACNIALQTGDMNPVKELLSRHIRDTKKRNSTDLQGNTALHVVCGSQPISEQQREDLLRYLLINKLDPTIVNLKGMLPADLLPPTSTRCQQLFPSKPDPSKQFHHWKQSADSAFSKDNRPQAAMWYDKCIEKCDTHRQLLEPYALAEMYHHAAVCQQNVNAAKALSYAQRSSAACNTYIEGHVLWARLAMKQSGSCTPQVRERLIMAYTYCCDVRQKSTLLYEFLSMTYNSPVAVVRPWFHQFNSSGKVWGEVLSRLAAEDAWQAARRLWQCGVLSETSMKRLDYSRLVNTPQDKYEEWVEWQEMFVIFLLQKDGSVKPLRDTICNFDGSRCESIMVSALNLALWSGSCKLFVWLVKNHRDSGKELQRKYNAGNSLLHLVCAPRGGRLKKEQMQTLCQCLMDNGVKKEAKNQKGEMPVDLLEKSHPCRQMLLPNSSKQKGGTAQSNKNTGGRPHVAPCTRCHENIRMAKNSGAKVAYTKLLNILTADHTSVEHLDLVKQSFAVLVDVVKKSPTPEIPKELLQKIPSDVFSSIAKTLYMSSSGWEQLHKILLWNNQTSYPFKQVLTTMDLSKYIGSMYCRTDPKQRGELLQLLLAQGVSGAGNEPIIKKAVACGDFVSVKILLQVEGQMTHLSYATGDTPLHAALDIALEKDPGNFEILTTVFKLQEEKGCSTSCQDYQGNTLFHKLVQMKFTEYTIKAAELLVEASVNPTLVNDEGKTAVQCISKTNSRLEPFVRMAAEKFLRTNDAASSRKQSQFNSFQMEQKEKQLNLPTTQQCLDEIDALIENISNVDLNNVVRETVAVETVETKSLNHEPRDDSSEDESVSSESESEPEEVVDNEDDDLENDIDIENVDTRIFDNLPWEIECTANVWKTLKNKKLPSDLRNRAILKIQSLGRGVWQPSFKKPLHHQGPSDVQLFSAKLSKAFRIVWEIAITFSPKRSMHAEQLLKNEEFGSTSGRIYSEVIRIWDIVLNHSHIHRAVQKVIRSHQRGEECILKSYVQGKGEEQENIVEMGKPRYPCLYTEVKSDRETDGTVIHKICPPGSPESTEYHIMKFYSVNASLVLYLLQSQDRVSVDFPFRVTEKEHAIISLTSNPPSPILLLGRSGTGKTTCCLYRLWTMFVNYWHRAQQAQDPLLPRAVCYTFNKEEEGQESEDDASSEDALDQDDDQQDESEASDEQDVDLQFDHLHQLFVTKNAVLCSEVQKNFTDLCHGTPEAKRFLEAKESQKNLPLRLQDVHPECYPMFLTTKQLWLMLDASLGQPYFFPRNDDGHLKNTVTGWDDPDDQVNVFLLLDVEDEEADENDLTGENPILSAGERPQGEHSTSQLRETTYEVFAFELWPKLNKEKLPYHPTLVWTEIVSFITGSVEALRSRRGFLSLEEYHNIGRKKAPNFPGNRESIYEVFLRYQRMKSQRGLFDEADLVHHLWTRLQQQDVLECTLHQIYIDETQDFTQAELFLLIHLCQDPNDMFFTGDTAQSIMRGISFRFEDLKSLFYYARESMKPQGKKTGVQVPSKVYQLPVNYRSHRGILNLASSIVDLLTHFFPESFDQLEPDRGLYDGPAPKILQSCSFADLALLISGNKREASQIEFGAHQAVLVVSEAARDNIPEELSYGIVLTIFESKGLEFDDVLLYNFFKDSQAKKEWRVVTDYLRKLEAVPADKRDDDIGHLVSVDMTASEKPRPLEFDPEKHKVLNSELKHLYTAITRARVNVWIYDEDPVSRAPMFEFFQARSLVKAADIEADDEGEVFAKSTGPDQWRAQGDKFFKRHIFHVAQKCYIRSGDEKKALVCLAHQRALEASNYTNKPTQMKDSFIRAAKIYLECGMYTEASRCMLNARKPLIAAKLYSKTKQFAEAAVIFDKQGKPREACEAYESALRFGPAVQCFLRNAMFVDAMDCIRRYFLRIEQFESENVPLPADLLNHRPPDHICSKENLCMRAAKYYHQHNAEQRMLEMLYMLPDEEQQIRFLKNNNHCRLAASLLQKKGRNKEAVELYLENGLIDEALSLCDGEILPDVRANCLLVLCRKIAYDQTMQTDNPCSNETKQECVKNLLEAEDLYKKCSQWVGVGEALLLQGMIEGDTRKCIMARSNFAKELTATMGQIECVYHWLKIEKSDDKIVNWSDLVTGCLTQAMELLHILSNPKARNRSNVEVEKINFCEGFYGIEREDGDKVVLKAGKTRIHCLKGESKRDISDAIEVIRVDLVRKAVFLVERTQQAIGAHLPSIECCPDYLAGFRCSQQKSPDLPSCPHQHQDKTYQNFLKHLDEVGVVLFMDCVISEKRTARDFKATQNDMLFSKVCNKDQYYEMYYSLLFPKRYHPRMLSDTPKHAVLFLNYLRRNKKVLQALKAFARRKWDKGIGRHADTALIMKVHNILMLCGCPISDTSKLLFEEQKQYKQRRRKDSDASALGFHFGRKHEPEMFFWNIVDGFGQLYGTKNPLKAASFFSQMLAFWAGNPEEPLLPSYATLSYVCEVFLMLSVSLFLRHSGTRIPVCLPASYLAQTNFVDVLYGKRDASQHAIVEQASVAFYEIKAIHGRLAAMVDVLTGAKSSDFDAVQDAFYDEEAIHSGETERILVLILTLMTNAGPGCLVPQRSISHLQSALSANNPAEVDYPQRVARAFFGAKVATDKTKLINILQNLLNEREDEYLYMCHWANGKLQYSKLDATRFPKYDYELVTEDLPHYHMEEYLTHNDAYRTDDAHGMEEYSEETGGTDDTTMTDANGTEPADARVEPLAVEQGAGEPAPDPLLLAQYLRVDDSMCSLCKVCFGGVQESTRDDDMMWADPDSLTTGRTDVLDESLPSMTESLVSKENHVHSQCHQQNVQRFQGYERMLKVDYLPVVDNINYLQVTLELMIEDEKPVLQKEMREQIGPLIENVQQQKLAINKLRSAIETYRSWDDRRDLYMSIQELEKCYNDLRRGHNSLKSDIERRQKNSNPGLETVQATMENDTSVIPVF